MNYHRAEPQSAISSLISILFDKSSHYHSAEHIWSTVNKDDPSYLGGISEAIAK